MKNSDYKIHIIGAGVSGLIAATVLEQNGFAPVIIEATDRPGGRVKTDIIDGYQLDHGFQVLLTAYPYAQKYLDLDALELQNFLPGAAIYKNGKQLRIGDPLRNPSLLFPTLFSGIGSFSDKLKILQLNLKLKNKSLSTIFSDKEQTTLSYLKGLGFSIEMINDFFKPFFSGIFLENKLETSSRMFEFVYKMFGEGYAALPKAGIEAIPKQLSQNLKHTSFRFITKVMDVNDGEISLADHTKLESDFTILATDGNDLIPNLKNQTLKWKSCDTLYFETEKRTIQKPLIGLIPKESTLINNIFYHTSLATNQKPNKELLSVTVIENQNLKSQVLIDRVREELQEHCGITTSRLIKHYTIPKALPDLTDLRYDLLPSETYLKDGFYLAGDIRLNGSLNAAMISGERAALAVIEKIGSQLAEHK